MSDIEYFSHLYEIASHLNKEFSLHAALRKALEKTVELLHLETGWIWLVQPDIKSVYLAAAYNLPPALSDHPERLSGWCYCIEKYLSDNIAKARNISEITCSRLKNISSGTRDLKFHATIPILTNGQKVGIINLVSKETQQLNDKQLSILNTISELIGMAIQRTRTQEAYGMNHLRKDAALYEVVDRVLFARIESLSSSLQEAKSFTEQKDIPDTLERINLSLSQVQEMRQQLSLFWMTSTEHQPEKPTNNKFQYPGFTLNQQGT